MADKSQKFITLVRLGFAARGLTYVLLGWLAISAGQRVREGNEAVYDMIGEWTFGKVLLGVIALGLLAYALFKFASAFADLQHHGSTGKGLAARVGDGASGVAHLVLSYAAFEFATGARQSANDGTGEAAQGLLAMDLGGVLLGLVGLGFIAGAVAQVIEAATAKFMERISSRAPQGVEIAGRLGHAARAVVFALVGWSLVQAAWFEQSGEAKGVGQALASLSDNGALYTLTAIGLILFGVFSLVTARYRIIPDFDATGLRPKLG